ncbi:stathmin domain-containing protein 1 [Salarias fasciatus]|uniref:stathmin domain-containing protein 1 n=1 Tax=Salarias fasciatus TaxID=181472 RepID=UPI001176CAA6|nr:stathmin domain-containing protein 1 [Salarias fasciatus]
MENREAPALPGAVPAKLPPLTSESVRESEADRVTQDGLLQKESAAQERLKSSEILEELLNEGIIPVEPARGTNSRAGEAYSIMLDDSEEVRRRPPARLESLRVKKTQSVHNKEEIDEKMRQVEERRKSREDELKTRLRTKSALVRRPAPVPTTEEEGGATLTFVEPLQSPLSPDPPRGPQVYGQITGGAAEEEEEESCREAASDGRQHEAKTRRSDAKAGQSRADQGETAKREGEEEQNEKEELTRVEEFRADKVVSTSWELESDSSFQQAEDKDEIF